MWPGTVSNFFRYNFSSPTNYILQTIYAFAFIAPAEELLFRGFIQGKLQKRVKPYIAITVQSILFGVLHGFPTYFMGVGAIYSIGFGMIGLIGGLMFGIAYYKTGNNIVAPWIAHAISDSPLALFIFGF